MTDRAKAIHRNESGVTLIETLVAVFIIGVGVLAYAALSQYIQVNLEAKRRAAAYNLAAEELEAIRALGYPAIAARNDAAPAAFLNVPVPYGNWSIAAAAAAVSSPNIYDSAGRSATASGLSGFAPIPAPSNFAATFTHFTVEAKVRIVSDSARADWGAGLSFLHQDEMNQYQLLLQDDSLTLARTITATDGTVTATTLYSGSPVINLDTWYTLRVRYTEDVTNNLVVSLNNTAVYTGTENAISRGALGLVTRNAAHAMFDDVRVATDVSNIPPTEPTWAATWSFDTGETPGASAAGWSRFGLNDIPDGTPDTPNDNGTITITDYAGNPDLKEVTATVAYETKNGMQEISLTTLLGKYGTAQ